MARAWRNHPFVFVPPVDTGRSRRRVLVTELLNGRRFEEVKQLDEAQRDRFGEIVFRFFFGTLKHTRRASGDPHPGNYLLLDDDRVGFLDFGLMRVVDADYLEGERTLAQAVARGDAEAVARAPDDARLPARARHVRPRAPAGADPHRRRVVPRARLPPPHARLRGRPARPQRQPALAVLRGDAARDDPARRRC